MMTVSELMRRHGIEKVVYVPASDLVPIGSFHAWPLDYSRPDEMCGIGPTVEEAIFDVVARKSREAA